MDIATFFGFIIGVTGIVMAVIFNGGDSRVKMSSGLAVANNIVKSHKGKLSVESNIGEGSSFTLILPISSNKE